jgi:hypothetical protein
MIDFENYATGVMICGLMLFLSLRARVWNNYSMDYLMALLIAIALGVIIYKL